MSMWPSVIFGMVIGMSTYIALGGEHYAMMLAITGLISMAGVAIGAYVAARR